MPMLITCAFILLAHASALVLRATPLPVRPQRAALTRCADYAGGSAEVSNGAPQDVIEKSVMENSVAEQQSGEAVKGGEEEQLAGVETEVLVPSFDSTVLSSDPAAPRVRSWPFAMSPDARARSDLQSAALTAEEAVVREAVGTVLKRMPNKWGESMEDRYARARAQLGDQAIAEIVDVARKGWAETAARAAAGAEAREAKAREAAARLTGLREEAAAAMATAKASADARSDEPYKPGLAEVMSKLPIKWGESSEERRARAEARLADRIVKLDQEKANMAKASEDRLEAAATAAARAKAREANLRDARAIRQKENAAAMAALKADADARIDPKLAEVMRTLPIKWGESLAARQARAEAKLAKREAKMAR